MANLGSDDTPVVADNVRTRVAEIDGTDSPYTTQGENQLEVDTSGGDVTVTIASADIPASGEPGRAVTIVNTAAGSVTIETEGAEQIQPDGVGSLTIETAGAYLDCRLLAGAVYVERNVSRNVIDASSANLTNTTTEQLGGEITNDPISSFTDGELFVDGSGNLTAAEAEGDILPWLPSDPDPVSVFLTSESTTVPSGETWVASVQMTSGTVEINNQELIDAEVFQTPRIVFPAGTEISETESRSLLISGFNLETGLTPVGEINPTVPSDETWVGSWISEAPDLNGEPISQIVNSVITAQWMILEGGDELDAFTSNAYFGGFKINE